MHSSWQKHQVFFIVLTTLFLQACAKADLSASVFEPSRPADMPTLEEDLFSEVPSGASFSKLTADASQPVERERLARFNYPLFTEFLQRHSRSRSGSENMSIRVRFDLFQDADEELDLNEIRMDSRSRWIATGRLTEDAQSVVRLELYEDSLTADIVSPRLNERYKVRPVGQGVHLIQTENVALETDMVLPPEIEDPVDPSGPADETPSNPEPIIDVLVAYTPRARMEQGGTDGILALIQKGISDANRAFEESGIYARVRLVGTLETKQNERRDLSKDLYALMGKKDGLWDEVHAERDRLKADQVSLVAVYPNESSLGGIGFFKARPDSAFTVLKTSAFSHFTFAHELGHNLGLDHSDGWRNPSAGFSTIMAYGNDRICRFSNPALTYQGELTGDPHHNEAAIINRNAPAMAAFR